MIELSEPKQDFHQDNDGGFAQITIPDTFPPGSILLYATEMPDLGSKLDELCSSGADEAFAELDLIDLNVLMYRAEGEERDATAGRDGVYTVPGLGAMTYCGTEGWMHPLQHIMRTNDLGHPLCGHLRDGPWAMDYVAGRLEK